MITINPRPRVKMVCRACGSHDVNAEATTRWNIKTQQWEIGDILEHITSCNRCGCDKQVVEVPLVPKRKSKDRVRFWYYGENGPVQITLRNGQAIHHTHVWDNGEGYSRRSVQWHYDGETVRADHVFSGTDCDGPHRTYLEEICEKANLHAGFVDAEYGVTYPAWKTLKHWQRDLAAEAMGY